MRLEFFGFFTLIRNNEKVEDIYGILKYRYNIDIDSIINKCAGIDSNNILDDISSIVIREVERSISENYIIENTNGDYISIINNTGNKNETDLSQILKYNLEACQVYLIVKTLLQYHANESLATVITSQKYELRSDTHIQPHKKSPLSQIFEDAQGAGKKGGDYKKNSLRYIGYLEPCHISSILTASINPYSKLNDDKVKEFIKTKGNFIHSPNVLDKNDFYQQYKRTYIGIQNNNRTLNALNAYATEKIYGFNIVSLLSTIWNDVDGDFGYNTERILLLFTTLDNVYEREILAKDFCAECKAASRLYHNDFSLDNNFTGQFTEHIEKIGIKYNRIVSFMNGFFYPCIFLTFYCVIQKIGLDTNKFIDAAYNFLDDEKILSFSQHFLVEAMPDSRDDLLAKQYNDNKVQLQLNDVFDKKHVKELYLYCMLFYCCNNARIQNIDDHLLAGDSVSVEDFLHPTTNAGFLNYYLLRYKSFIEGRYDNM